MPVTQTTFFIHFNLTLAHLSSKIVIYAHKLNCKNIEYLNLICCLDFPFSDNVPLTYASFPLHLGKLFSGLPDIVLGLSGIGNENLQFTSHWMSKEISQYSL